MLDTTLIQGRRLGYARCSAEASAEATEAAIYGDLDCICAAENKAMFYWWAADVMNRTPIADDECQDCLCVTDEFACEVINLMDAGCIECGCGADSDRPIVCEVEPDLTVYRSADALLQTILLPAIGIPFLIVSNNNNLSNDWGSHLGEIAVSDGATWTYTVPPVGSVIYDAQFLQYWIAYAGGVGLQFPAMNGTVAGTNMVVSSASPQVSAAGTSTIVIESSIDGVTWTGVYVGPENYFAINRTFTVAPLTAFIRSQYNYNEEFCQSPIIAGEIPPPSGRLSLEWSADGANQRGSLINDYVGVSSVGGFFQHPEWTYSFWIKSEGTLAGAVLVLDYTDVPSNNGTSVYLSATDVYLFFGNASMLASAATLDGAWHHIAITKSSVDPVDYTNGLLKFYVDGIEVPVTGGANPAGVLRTSLDARILRPGGQGSSPTVLSGYFRMCEIYMCNTQRSQLDIQDFLMTGLVAANDAAWDRNMYIVPTQYDAVDVVNGISANVPGPTNMFTSSDDVKFSSDSPLP